MKITLVRRISQIFFFILFVWFCVVTSLGEKFWQIRGWPVNLFLELDPLVSLGTILTTHKLYWPLLWSLLTVVLTIVFGRFFCGWLCPFGSIHQFTGYIWNRRKPVAKMVRLNSYRPQQKIKYYILILFIVAALFPLSTASLQIGLLDPISLLTRTFNLALLPVADMKLNVTSMSGRFYEGAWLVLLIFMSAVFLNLFIPRFYCRFICPLGALFGILGRFAIFRIGKNHYNCSDCKRCEEFCEGACEPNGPIRTAECVMCLNCREECKDDVMNYSIIPSRAGEVPGPDLSRKGFIFSLAGSVFILPAFRLGRQIDSNWLHTIIRPPGSLEESEFLKRCIKCGECIRICPTNVLQPGSTDGGFENLWTPVLNNRIGSSGCQQNCTACGQICPTSAIRPVTLDEKLGKGKFADTGFIKIGTAFIDRNLCLPWSMDKPCIVCQENCPVSPKAIHTDEIFNTVRGGVLTVKSVHKNIIEVSGNEILKGKNLTGDYFCLMDGNRRIKILSLSENSVVISPAEKYYLNTGSKILIQVRLQRPYVDIEQCTGCGICEHECPVSGLRAVRVSGVGESRSRSRAMLLKQ